MLINQQKFFYSVIFFLTAASVINVSINSTQQEDDAMQIEKPSGGAQPSSDVLGKRARSEEAQSAAEKDPGRTLKRASINFSSINKISQIDTRDINDRDLVLFDIDSTLIQDKDFAKQLIDKDAAKFIRLLQSKGALCIAFTSRSIYKIDETSKELKRLGIDFSNVPLKSIKLPSSIEIDASVRQKYQDGIIYTNMHNLSDDPAYREKGGVLVKFFDALKEAVGAGLTFRKIIFVDDRQSELESVRDVADELITKRKRALEFYLYKLDTKSSERRLEGRTKLYGPALFPDNLRGLRCIGHSTEGSTGVFFLKDSQGNKYTFKCLSDPDLMKEEILADAIYAALGVPVPAFAIYDEKPDLSGVEQKCGTMGPYRVSQFIVTNRDKTADIKSVKDRINHHFVIDAFMGNRDVVVGNFKNIIVDAAGTPYRIDNGGSLRYTSVGKVKHEEKGYNIYKVTELDSLRDPAINKEGAQVYQLTRDEINNQILDLLKKKDLIFKTVDDLSTVLDIDDPEDLKNILAYRLKYLEEQRQGPSRIVGAYEEAQSGTSVSVLMYTQISAASADTYVLLGRRVNHHPGTEDVWSSLGGKSDVGTGDDDQLLVDTAAREVREESVGLITFTPLQLINFSSHDLIEETQEGSKKLFHRMYLAPYHFINPEELKQKISTAQDIHQREYTEFAWVKVNKDFLAALEACGKAPFAITVTKSDGHTATIKLLENFGKMLAQIQVRNLLSQIKERKNIGGLHTRSVVGQEQIALNYKWQQSGAHWVRKYEDEREELALPEPKSIQGRERAYNFMALAQTRADQMRALNEKVRAKKGEPAQTVVEASSIDYPFTQTEAFLSLALGSSESKDTRFRQQEREQNVDKFFRRYPLEGDATKVQEFSNILKGVYKKELENKAWFVFYHAADPSVAFLWDLYTEFRNQLHYVHGTGVRALRGWDEFFKGMVNVDEFIVKSKEESGGGDIKNYEGAYQERGLAVNFALFGSYINSTSSSYELFYNSKSIKPPDTGKLLLAFLVKVGAPLAFKKHILAIKDKYFPDATNGRLLQIFMNERVLDQVVYLSYARGSLLNPAYNNANLKAQRMLALLRTTPEAFMKEIQEKASGDHELNSLQARVFLKPEIMFNPKEVFITSYMMHPLAPAVHESYKKEMQALVKQLLSYVFMANTAADDTFSTQQPLLRDYQQYYQGATGKKYRKGEIDSIMAVKKYIDTGNIAELEQIIEANPGVLKDLIPDLSYLHVSSGSVFLNPFSYALNNNKTGLVIALVKKGKGFEEAIAAATEGMKSRTDGIKESALALWKALFEKGQGFAEASAAVTEGVRSSGSSIKKSALALGRALVEKKQGFAEAIAAAAEGVKSSDSDIKESALALWKALVEKDQGFAGAIADATEGMKSRTDGIKESALALWKALFEKGQGFAGAIAAATEGMKSSDSDIKESVLALWKALVEKDQGFAGAIAAATECVKSSDYRIKESALALWQALFEKGQGFKEASEAATEGVKSIDHMVRASALALWKALVAKGQGFKEAAAAATEAVKGSVHNIVKKSALDLWKALVEKDKGFVEAIAAATEGVKSPNNDTKKSALALWQALFEKNQGFVEAIAAATEGVKNSDYRIKESALALWKALVKKGQGFAEAIAAATEGVKISNKWVKVSALNLWVALFEKGQGFEEARKSLISIPSPNDKRDLENQLNEYEAKIKETPSKGKTQEEKLQLP